MKKMRTQEYPLGSEPSTTPLSSGMHFVLRSRGVGNVHQVILLAVLLEEDVWQSIVDLFGANVVGFVWEGLDPWVGTFKVVE